MYYQTTFIGLRERGSEGIACPKGVMRSSGGYPNIVHRPIGRFVVSGRRRGWSLPLGRFLIPSSRACLSSFRHAVRFARSHSTGVRLRPAVGYPEQCSREASASVGSSSFPTPPYIQFGTDLRIKRKKNLAPRGTDVRVLQLRRLLPRRYIFQVSPFLDTVAKLVNNSIVTKSSTLIIQRA